MKQPQLLIGPSAWQEAERRARFGHKTWIAWIENETQHASLSTPAIIKRALLATGTQGSFMEFGSSAFIIGWRMGLNMLAHHKRGYCK